MVSFHQISKMGENIKVDICKCPINVKLVKKSSHRPGTLQMPFQIHLHLCAILIFKKKHFNHNSILKRLQLNKRKKKTSCQLVKKVYLGSCSNGVHTTRQFRIHSPHVYLMSYLAGILKHIHTYIHFHNKVISIILDRKGYICYVMSRSAK